MLNKFTSHNNTGGPVLPKRQVCLNANKEDNLVIAHNGKPCNATFMLYQNVGVNVTWSNVNVTEPKKINLECSCFPLFFKSGLLSPARKNILHSSYNCFFYNVRGGNVNKRDLKKNYFRRDPFFLVRIRTCRHDPFTKNSFFTGPPNIRSELQKFTLLDLVPVFQSWC